MHNLDMMNHMKQLKAALTELQGQASINPVDLSMDLQINGHSQRFLPQFTLLKEGHRSYSPEFSAEAYNFNGWFPYLNKGWDLSSEKLKFKQFVTAAGLRTPFYTADASARPRDVIIKQNTSSFGETLRGPFRVVGEQRPETLLQEGEYYEQFTFGWVAKAWFWNDRPVCLKLLEMPTVTGDGATSVRALIERKREFVSQQYPDGWLDIQNWALLDNLIDYQGVGQDDVLDAGRKLLIDYRYNHCWLKMTWDPDNVLPACEVEGIHDQLREIGAVLWRGIPEPIRENTLYTVDAILDSRDCLWLLEMNSNPQVHPDLYLPMLRDLFPQAPRSPEVVATSADVPAPAVS